MVDRHTSVQGVRLLVGRAQSLHHGMNRITRATRVSKSKSPGGAYDTPARRHAML
jgi:hypothetical protein